jgi:hypothetical protein
MTGMLFPARNCCTTSDVWLGANADILLYLWEFSTLRDLIIFTTFLVAKDLGLMRGKGFL